jgi:hypothetical protein
MKTVIRVVVLMAGLFATFALVAVPVPNSRRRTFPSGRCAPDSLPLPIR